jgi:glutathione S-transferase
MFFGKKRKEKRMLIIYGVPISVHTRKAIVTAILKDIPYRNEPVIPFNPPENWSLLSPTGLIPAISHDGFELADSVAICGYLEKLKPAPSIYPSDAKAYGRALWLEQYAGSVLFKEVIHPLFHQKIIRPHILKQGEPNQTEIERVQTEIAPGIFAYLNAQISDGFFTNGALTIADIAVASNLLNYHYLGFRLDPARYPKLTAWFSRTIGEKPFRSALKDEEPFASQMGLDRTFLA